MHIAISGMEDCRCCGGICVVIFGSDGYLLLICSMKFVKNLELNSRFEAAPNSQPNDAI